MIWSTESSRGSNPHQETKGRAGTATVLFSCQPLHAPEVVWKLPKIVVPFSVIDNVLQYGGDFEAVQRDAIEFHDAECPGHQGQHHFMLTAGFTYTSSDVP